MGTRGLCVDAPIPGWDMEVWCYARLHWCRCARRAALDTSARRNLRPDRRHSESALR